MREKLPKGHYEKLQKIDKAFREGSLKRSPDDTGYVPYPHLGCNSVSENVAEVLEYRIVRAQIYVGSAEAYADRMIQLTGESKETNHSTWELYYEMVGTDGYVSHFLNQDPTTGLFVDLTRGQFTGFEDRIYIESEINTSIQVTDIIDYIP